MQSSSPFHQGNASQHVFHTVTGENSADPAEACEPSFNRLLKTRKRCSRIERGPIVAAHFGAMVAEASN